MISVIANFYNSAPFIPRLMESMFAQTCSDWELICVDDCSPSPDDLRLLRRYEADPRAREYAWCTLTATSAYRRPNT